MVPPFAVMLAGLIAANVNSFGAARSSGSTNGQNLAAQLIEQGGLNRGLCVYMGEHLNTALEIAQASELLVHVRDPQYAAVNQLRTRAAQAGLGINRIAVEQGATDRLPYAENLVDLIVANGVQQSAQPAEVLRALRPGGIALIRQPQQGEDELRSWQQAATAAGAQHIQAWKSGGTTWIRFTKPTPKGIDEWTHWEHGPDNNPVSTDSQIKAPYMTQFMARPFYIGMPAITTAAGGRTFLAIGHIAHHQREWNTLNKLIARNGYNGTVLWEQDLPDGYLVHRSAFIATKDTFYMINGDHCRTLDPQTGANKGEIRIPGVTGDWKWMVMHDGNLFVLTGEKAPWVETTKGDRTFGGWSWSDLSRGYYGPSRNSQQTDMYKKSNIPWGYGNTLAAYDIKNKRLLWKHTEENRIDSRAMALGGGKVYFYCPGHHLGCLEAKSGNTLWTNDEQKSLTLIEERGKGLTSTPGFKTACLTLFTPDALIIQGQSRMNVVAVSTKDGYLLWTKKKVTNNPNGIYVDGKVILGVGPGGSHVAIDPISGEVTEDLQFRKVACTRLTASTDSFFCRGEGMMRFDRGSKTALIDGSVRPACNDGALPANGLLYLGPWQCDCNLSLIGNIARCSAGDFRFDVEATTADRLQLGEGDVKTVATFDISENDWPTLRADNDRSAGTSVDALDAVVSKWQFKPDRTNTPTAPVAAGGLTFLCGTDGNVRAFDSKTGKLRWQFATPGIIKMPPTIAEGRAFVGSGDGCVYALEASTGRMLWRFRAAPVERHIMVYGNLSSTWPVHSGVLVNDGVAYFAAGIIDYDGTYVFALDAKTGEIRWQNNTSGHLNAEIRKGVSAQGNLSIQGNRLLLAGGNQISPAPFDLKNRQAFGGSPESGAAAIERRKIRRRLSRQTYDCRRQNPVLGSGKRIHQGKLCCHHGSRPGFDQGNQPRTNTEPAFAIQNSRGNSLRECPANCPYAGNQPGSSPSRFGKFLRTHFELRRRPPGLGREDIGVCQFQEWKTDVLRRHQGGRADGERLWGGTGRKSAAAS